MNLYIYPWDERSNGAREIKDALKIRRILHRNSKFQGTKDTTVINWGATTVPTEVMKCRIINHPSIAEKNADKLLFFHQMETNKGGRIPEWTTKKDVVGDWISKGKTVVARTKTRAKSGAGIVFFEDLQNFVSAPLFTVYVPKKEEYRVHFAFDEMIDIQQKVLRKTDDSGNPIDPKKVDWRVRNAKNGFIFIRNNLHTPTDVVDQAMQCAKASGLDFGAVDVVWNEKTNKAYVLEINTAPGIEGTTIESYVTAFRKALL